MTRVAVIGNLQHYHCSEARWARAFTALGCDVTPLQIDDVVRNPDVAMRVLAQQDAITYTRTHAVGRYLDQSWSERWQELERAGVKTIGLHLDRFWDLEREPLIHSDAQFTVGTLWTADGGNDDRFAAAGVNHRWLPPGADADEMLGGQHRRDWAYDVIFVGSKSYHREYPERPALIDHLRTTYGRRFAHFGHGGDHPVVRGQALNDAYRSAKIVVGDSCFANSPPERRPVDYWSERCPEVLAAGGALLIHPWIRGLSKQFTTGRDYVTHNPGDWEDLDCQIGAYLANPTEREAIAANGRARVLREHTWTHRMAVVLADAGLTVDRAEVSSFPS